MSDRRYDRGGEDMAEAVARLVERLSTAPPGLADVIRALVPSEVRAVLSADDAWMRGVADRDLERVRAGFRERTVRYQRRLRGEEPPAAALGPRPGWSR